MAGLLGAFVKGAAGAAAEQYNSNHQFNMKRALMEAEADMKLRLEEAGYQRDEARKAALVEKRRGILTEAEKRTRGSAGGYQTEEMKADEDRRVLEAQASELDAAGYDNKYQVGQMSSRDRAAVAEARQAQAEAKYKSDLEYKDKVLGLREEQLNIQRNKGNGSGGGKKGLTAAQERANMVQEEATRELEGVEYGSISLDRKDASKYGGYGRFFRREGEYITEFNRDGSKNPEFTDLNKLRSAANKPYIGESPDSYATRKGSKSSSKKRDISGPPSGPQFANKTVKFKNGQTVTYDAKGNPL